MVKRQQMGWSLHGAHVLMQVRMADLNGDFVIDCGHRSDS
jgi:hypothetical protein